VDGFAQNLAQGVVSEVNNRAKFYFDQVSGFEVSPLTQGLNYR